MPCSYDCTEGPPDPLKPKPYGDISGIGVVFGVMITAYLAVAIIIGHYVLAFQPALDPFREDGNEAKRGKIRGNPLDAPVLSWRVGKEGQQRPVIDVQSERRRGRVEAAFEKCALSMSDLQIVTGIAILVSGYSSLPCRLSIYHWQILTYLAWFSSITHLSILTFLRRFLFTHRGERIWRLVAMFLFLCMLVTAIVPTARFEWDTKKMALKYPGEYAICYFHLPQCSNCGSYSSMVVSILLLLFGSGTRVVKLHEVLSRFAKRRIRDSVGRWYKAMLRWLYTFSNSAQHSNNLKRSLLFRPALRIFLVARLWTDLYSSMLSEVYWLIVSIIWGSIHLLRARGVPEKDDNEWGFGQIMPIISLAAPLIAVSGYFLSEDKLKSEDATTVPSDRAPIARLSQNDDGSEDDTELQTPGLNREFYSNVGWFQFGVIPLTLSLVLLLTSHILLSVAEGSDAIISFTNISWWILFFLPSLPCFYALTCLTFEDMNWYPEKRCWKLTFHSLLMFVLFGWAFILIWLPGLTPDTIIIVDHYASVFFYGSFALEIYILFSFTICIIGIKRKAKWKSDTAVVNLLPIAASQDV